MQGENNMKIHKHLLETLLVIVMLLAACSSGAPQPNAAPTTAPTVQAAAATQPPTALPATTVAPTDPPVAATATTAQAAAPATTEAAAQSSGAPTATPALIPLQDALPNLQPQEVFQNFYNITQVPRPSGYMDKIRPFLVDFGNSLGLETVVDDAGNVIIRKPGTAGLENAPGIVLQAHMDMVAQKGDDVTFDFETDPIQAYVSGDYLVTQGTTLGADDGIGMAVIMAVLQSKTLKTGPIEGLFTVDEETTMSGANGLKADELKGRTMINLDWETEGSFAIGSAGGEHVTITSTYKQVGVPSGMVSYQVKVDGLKGGHSGVDINEGRGHATKLLVRLLYGAQQPYGIRLASITDGTASNAIPRTATAIVFLPGAQVDAFTSYVQDFEKTVQSELAATEPDLTVTTEAVQPPDKVMDENFQKILIDMIYGTPQGVLRMSDTVPGLVETSNNLGISTIQDGMMELMCYPRSSVDSELTDAGQMVSSVWELGGYQAVVSDRYGGWTPNPDSPIVQLMQKTYKDLYNTDATLTAVHAGLECGAIGGIYPDMDMISIGPTLADVHSPSENLYIPSAQKVYDLLTTALESFASSK
jgi:dipeptidase D